MGKTVNYRTENAKRRPQLFVIAYFNEKAGVWMETKGKTRRAKAEAILRNMQIDNQLARMEIR